jgi:predicted kinase
MELVLLVGLQASGKTSFYRARFSSTHAHVSRDNFRNNRNPTRRQRVLVEEALRAGRPVVVDNTNPTPEDRAPLIELGRARSVPVIGYYFQSRLDECKQRNAARNAKARVPDVALHATITRLCPPRPEEGFDRLYFVHLDGAGGFHVEPWRCEGEGDTEGEQG